MIKSLYCYNQYKHAYFIIIMITKTIIELDKFKYVNMISYVDK